MLRDRLVDAVTEVPRTAVNVTAAILAAADASALLLGQGEDKRELLGAPPQFRLDPEALFHERFQWQLTGQRVHRRRKAG